MADNSKTLRELIEEGPTGGSAVSERAPIGVPDGYAAPRTRNAFGIPGRFKGPTIPKKTEYVSPRYFEGAELAPAGMSPQAIARLQRDLVDAGLLTGKFRLGYWDAASQKAYYQVLTYANQSGKTDRQAIAELKTRPEMAGADEERAPLVVKTTDPDSLRSTFRDVSRKLLGRALSDDELNRYIAAYNQVETQKQQEAYNIEAPGSRGGTVSTIPESDTYFEERLRKERPADVEATAVNARADEFFGLLGAFGGD